MDGLFRKHPLLRGGACLSDAGEKPRHRRQPSFLHALVGTLVLFHALLSHADTGQAAVIAATCVTCHAPVATPGGIPSLQGRSADELLTRLRAFKAIDPAKADAQSTIMPLLLQGYDDEQIKAVARWIGNAREQRP